MAACLLLTASPAHAKTFTVNYPGDGGDQKPGDGECFTGLNIGLVGPECTLRAAIQEANKFSGADTINFDIGGGTGVKTISPASDLPPITQPVTIDGYTQSGATENTLTQPGKTNAVLKIELGGTSGASIGLEFGIGASKSVIRGLAINNFGGQGIFFNGGKGHKVEGNFIGTDPSGTVDKGHGFGGVVLSSTDGSTIGGITPDKRNLISGNDLSGVWLQDGSSGNEVQGNLIGTDKNGTSPLSNTGNGVFLGDSSNNTVGDADPSDGATNAANTIAFNTFVGVDVEGAATGNRILSNSIFSNVGLGIDLGTVGVTANDDKDPDTGANRLQNFPLITSATTIGSGTAINGTLNSTPSTKKKKSTFTIQFFSNPSTNPDEGKTFLGEIQVKTERQGNASFGFSTSAVSEGQYITATATNNKTGDTSEFSEARVVTGPVIGP